MTLQKIWLHGLELEIVAAETNSSYSVAYPNMKVTSSETVHNATSYLSTRHNLQISIHHCVYWLQTHSISTGHKFVTHL
jgi:uncharacterized protein YcfL